MTHESDITTILVADATLMAILTGGIYARGALGRSGLTRENVSAAFDGTTGFLLPSAVVRGRTVTPDGDVQDSINQLSSTFQVVEVYVYEDSGYVNVDSALDRIYVLLQGFQMGDTFPLEWGGTVNRVRDRGALDGASMARQDWVVYQVREV